MARTWMAMAAAVAMAMFAGQAAAQLVNGSFETGTTAGWTATGGCPFDVVPPGPTTGAGAFPAQAPVQGAFLMMSDANAPGTCTLFQDVALAGSGAYSISAATGYNYFNFTDPAAPGCSAALDVTTPGGVLIAHVFQASGPTNQPIVQRAPVVLPNVGGTTVRVIVTTVNCLGGPVGIVLDAVALAPGAAVSQVPTLNEWATMLLALLIAASGALYMRSRTAAPKRT
jgi:hypothetical protein